MNILVSSAILAMSIILLAHSIYELRPHRKKKTKRKQSRSKKSQSITRVKSYVIDLTQTDLKANS